MLHQKVEKTIHNLLLLNRHKHLKSEPKSSIGNFFRIVSAYTFLNQRIHAMGSEITKSKKKHAEQRNFTKFFVGNFSALIFS